MEQWLPVVGRWGKWEDVHQRVQLQLRRASKSRDLTYSMMTINTTVLLWAMCQESRFQILSLHTQKKQLCEKMLISLTVLTSSLCVSKHHAVHLDYGQFLFLKKDPSSRSESNERGLN